jgi:hypothetical protein
MSIHLADYLNGLRTPQTTPTRTTALYGKPLVYLIGAGSAAAHPGCVVEAPYGQNVAGENTFKIAYCNLFNEKYGEQSEDEKADLGPYLTTSDTAKQYSEGQIDPAGQGWLKNLTAQFAKAKAENYQFVELDNPDAYSIEDVLGAIKVAADYRLAVIAKNPQLVDGGAVQYVSHPNVWGMIVERGAGRPDEMDALRKSANKGGIIPVWFVFDGSSGANQCAEQIRQGNFKGMSVTYSTGREKNGYNDSTSVLSPTP